MKVRVSIGNLVCGVVRPRISVVLPVGILSSGAYKKGQLRYQPVGGAAELTQNGRLYLEDRYGAENFHRSEEGRIDARFEVDDLHLEAVFAFFRNRNPRFFEIDPKREIVSELSTVELKSGALPEIPPVLSTDEAESIEVVYVDTVVQPFSDSPGTSTLAKEGVPSRRLFHRFSVVVTDEILRKMLKSKAVRFLHSDEIGSTDGGAHKGTTHDGIELADNFI